MTLKIEAHPQTTNSEHKHTNELVFVVMEGVAGGQTAIEGNFGLVAFGENNADLIADIRDKVRQHFNPGFTGQIRLRKFTDILIEG